MIDDVSFENLVVCLRSISEDIEKDTCFFYCTSNINIEQLQTGEFGCKIFENKVEKVGNNFLRCSGCKEAIKDRFKDLPVRRRRKVR